MLMPAGAVLARTAACDGRSRVKAFSHPCQAPVERLLDDGRHRVDVAVRVALDGPVIRIERDCDLLVKVIVAARSEAPHLVKEFLRGKLANAIAWQPVDHVLGLEQVRTKDRDTSLALVGRRAILLGF